MYNSLSPRHPTMPADPTATGSHEHLHRAPAAAQPSTRQQIEQAEAKAASICNLTHLPGAGCIKCNGLVTAELSGRLTSPVVRAEKSAVPMYGEKPPIEALQGGPVRSPSDNERERALDPAGQTPQHPLTDEGPRAEVTRGDESEKRRHNEDAEVAAKERPMYGEKPYWGTEWAGKTAPDGTQVPQLAVCDFGYGKQPAPHMMDSHQAPGKPILEDTTLQPPEKHTLTPHRST